MTGPAPRSEGRSGPAPRSEGRSGRAAMTVAVEVNGEADRVPPGTNVSDLVERLGIDGRGIVVAVNRSVVPRSAWATVELAPGDVVEVLHAAQGG